MNTAKTNIYHHEYTIGGYLTLIQFYYQRREHDSEVLSCERLLGLIKLRKINCRYVHVRTMVLKVVERVEYDLFTAGFVGVADHFGRNKLVVGHYQYPSYEKALRAKYRWNVYRLDLGVGGKVNEGVYEDKSWVVAKLTGKRIPIRVKLLLGMGIDG